MTADDLAATVGHQYGYALGIGLLLGLVGLLVSAWRS